MFIVGLNPLSPLIFMTGYLPRYPVVLRYVMMYVTSLNNATTAVGSTKRRRHIWNGADHTKQAISNGCYSIFYEIYFADILLFTCGCESHIV